MEKVMLKYRPGQGTCGMGEHGEEWFKVRGRKVPRPGTAWGAGERTKHGKPVRATEWRRRCLQERERGDHGFRNSPPSNSY